MILDRIALATSILVGIGWLLAVGITLFVWLPQFAGSAAPLHMDAALYLQFVYENSLSWQWFHIGATLGLAALLPLIPLLSADADADPRRVAFVALGLAGATFGLLASIIDQFGTPVLARFSVNGSVEARIIWEAIEGWREFGLKGLSYWFLGFWLFWMGGVWQRQEVKRLGLFSRLLGSALLLLALVETLTSGPLRYQLGERGVGGLVVLLLPAWAFSVAYYRWQKSRQPS